MMLISNIHVYHVFDIEVKYRTFNTYVLSTLKINLTLNMQNIQHIFRTPNGISLVPGVA
jgi:hypothetical protein